VAIPEKVRIALSTYYVTNTARNVFLLNEAGSLCDRFHGLGIPVMLLKGIALLEDVYPHLALRPMSDIDILVHKRDLSAVRRVLTSECGYQDGGFETPSAEIVACRTTLGKMAAPAHLGRLLLEVHWDIAPLEYEWKLSARSPLMDFWKRAQKVRVGQHTAFAPAPADHLCYLAIHNCAHCFDRLMGLVDIAYFMARFASDASWQDLTRRATRYSCRMDLLLNVGLAHALFKFPIAPDALRELAEVEGRATHSGALAPLRAWLLARLFTPEAIFDEGFSSARRYMTRMLSMDGFGDALRLLVRGFFPSQAWLAHRPGLRGIEGPGRKRLAHFIQLGGNAWKAVRRLVERPGKEPPA
jgi:hypothetical protein